MAYTPPAGNLANVDFADDGAYSPPAGNAANVDFAATGAGYRAGDANITEAADTTSASGTVVNTSYGTANIAETADTTSAVGVILVQGVGTPTETADTTTATGAVLVQGTASATETADTITGIGGRVEGNASITETADTTTATASVLVQGVFNKNETADTITATGGHTFAFTALASNGGLNWYSRAVFNSMVSPSTKPIAAPYVYIDSGSAMATPGAFPLNTSVSLGDKYAYGADTLHPYQYWECTQAGTTGGTHIFSIAQRAGFEVASGGAKFRIRNYHGWARAKKALVANIFDQSVTIDSNYIVNGWTAFVASGHSQSEASSFNQYMVQPKTNGALANLPGHTIISVDKSVNIPVTFTAGASILATGNNSGMTPMAQSGVGLLRGLTVGHDNTSASGTNDAFDWDDSVRWYDCTFQTYRQDDTFTPAHTGMRHSVRCTFKSSHATNPAMMTNAGAGDFEAATFTRLTSAATPFVSDYFNVGGYTMFLGADLSTFTGGKFYNPASAINAAVRTMGVRVATSGLVQPTVSAMDVVHTTIGTTAVGEMDYLKSPVGDWYDDNSVVATPSLSRENTIVRTGGASDSFGSYSYKTTVNIKHHYPFTFEFWNQKVDESFLVTIEFIWSSTGTGLSTLKNEDVWLEAMYLNDTVKNSADLVFSFDKYNRRGLIYNDATGPAALATTSSTWGGSVSNPVKQKVSIVVTPKKVGRVIIFVGVWLCPWTQNQTSSTSIPIYFDPLPVLSAAP